jgi:hypothetical protein
MSAMVNHTKCQKCQKILNVVDINENPEGIGHVCIDVIACKNREQENTLSSNQSLKPAS